MKKQLLLFFIPFLMASETSAQKILNQYLDSALNNNIVLQQKNITLQQAIYALKTAKGMFYPRVGIQASYTTADGGRNISLPIGDMLNGVYTTLNQLTQTQKFPQLENKSINFLPQNYYDMKVHTEVPIFNSKLNYNKKIKNQQVALTQYQIDIYKRELVAKVKKGYYQYLQSIDAISIYRSALELAKENKKINESLLKNGKGLPAYVLRAKSKIEAVKAQLIAAKQQKDNAKHYFNFLLNRKLKEAIKSPIEETAPIDHILTLLNTPIDVSQREELQELQKYIAIKENIYKMKKAIFYPSLNGFLDLGSQAENLQFNSQSKYFMAGLQLEIPLFEGNKNRNNIKQAQLSVQKSKLNSHRITQKLKLGGSTSKGKLRTAYQEYLSAKKRLKSAKAYHHLISEGYKKGVNAYIEVLDAQDQLTKAKLAVNINQYKMQKAKAELERATASYKLN
ncbi:MAG TPA: TolC family protein [Chitinophagaceae bacterium]|nr:TolC family protein [Chitinophagaceae bacterium]